VRSPAGSANRAPCRELSSGLSGSWAEPEKPGPSQPHGNATEPGLPTESPARPSPTPRERADSWQHHASRPTPDQCHPNGLHALASGMRPSPIQPTMSLDLLPPRRSRQDRETDLTESY
jgi:hypothetical protein